MKNALLFKTSAALLALCAIGGVAWSVKHDHAGSASIAPGPASASAGASASDSAIFASIPPSAGQSLSDKAIAKWVEAARQNDKDDKAWTNLGDALMQKARETLDLSYYGRAEQAYNKALTLNPHRTDALIGMAWVNSSRHEFEKSTEWANKAIAVDPQSNDAYGLIGDADVEMGNYDAAYTHYQKMLDIRPDTASYSRGAHLLALTGDTRKGVWLMTKAIRTGAPYAENTAWCRAQLALMLYNDGAVLPAEQILSDALKLAPNNYYVLFAMGRVQTAKRNYPAAIKYYQRAVAVVPQHDALVGLGDLYHITGRQADADNEYALVEAVHKLQKANGVRGDWQMAQFDADHDRNLPEALQMVQEEYKTRPNVYVMDTLAWCLYKNGRYAEAKVMSDKATSHKTPEAGFLFHAGMIEAKLGDRVAAEKDLYQALSLNPNFSAIYASVASQTLKQIGSAAPDKQFASAH